MMVTDLCMHCRKPVRYRADEERWVHTESVHNQCEPGEPGGTNAFVFPGGMRLVQRTRTTILDEDGHRLA